MPLIHVGRGSGRSSPARSLAAYAALRTRLAEELGVDPAPQTQDLHLAVLRDQRADLPGRPGRAPAPPSQARLAYRPGGRSAHRAAGVAGAACRGQDGDWPRAARAWLLAAEDAMRRYAASDAGTLATQALDAARRAGNAEVGARPLVVRGRAREAHGAHDIALADLTEGASAARAAGDRRLEMLALRELGGDVPVSRGLPITYYASNLQSGLRIAESLGDRASEADLLSRLAIIAANRLHLDEALRASLRAVTAARASADDRALAAALDGLKLAYLSLGDLAWPGRRAGRAHPAAPPPGRPVPAAVGRVRSPASCPLPPPTGIGPRPAFETAVEVNRRGGYPHCAAWYVAHLGWLARLRGRDGEALALGRQAVALTGERQHTWWRAAACAMLGGTVLRTGDRAAAIALFERGLAAAGEAGVEAYLLRCAAPLAAATGSRTALTDASRLLEQATIPAGGAWLPRRRRLSFTRPGVARPPGSRTGPGDSGPSPRGGRAGAVDGHAGGARSSPRHTPGTRWAREIGPRRTCCAPRAWRGSTACRTC